jgi:hypothetical protein
MATVTVRGNATSVTLIESDSDIQTYLLGVINLYIIYTMPCIPWNISPVCCMNVVRGILAVMFEYFIDIWYLAFRSTHQICVWGIISVKTASSYSANTCCNVPTVRVQIPARKTKTQQTFRDDCTFMWPYHMINHFMEYIIQNAK